MMPYEEFLDEPITTSEDTHMRREDYYKKYMPSSRIKDAYDQYVRLEKE